MAARRVLRLQWPVFSIGDQSVCLRWEQPLEPTRRAFPACVQAVKRIITVEYQWQSFMIVVGMSIAGLLFGAAVEWVFRKVSKRPYDLTDPFVQRDIMPVDGKADSLSEKSDDHADVAAEK